MHSSGALKLNKKKEEVSTCQHCIYNATRDYDLHGTKSAIIACLQTSLFAIEQPFSFDSQNFILHETFAGHKI